MIKGYILAMQANNKANKLRQLEESFEPRGYNYKTINN